MKIAILSTPSVALPPTGFAGVERVVYELQEGLTEKKHDVTVYATGDSHISSKLKYFYDKALDPSVKLTYNAYYFLNHVYHFMKDLEKESFDIIHFNDARRFSLYFHQYLKTPFITTLHGAYAVREHDAYSIGEETRNQLELFKDLPYVSISNAQRKDLPNLRYIKTIYNAVNSKIYEFSEAGGEQISWLGRVTPDKGLDTAIIVAENVSKKIKASGFIDEGQRNYFDSILKPLLGKHQEHFEFITEIKNQQQKNQFLALAKAFLFPLRWEEPFGLVMIESMASGTPVVAFAKGSVSEVVKDGETGFIINPSPDDIRGNWIIKKTGIEGLCEAVERIYSLPSDQYRQMRQNCRKHVEDNFTIQRMVDEYEKVYQQITSNS